MQLKELFTSEVVRVQLMVPMRDGVQLATDVYLPSDNQSGSLGRLPTILERTAYGRTIDSRSEIDAGASKRHSRAEVARFFVERGYAVVYQDCRGRHDSQGEFVKYLSEATDGSDTVNWICQQSWSNGKVATKGLSYGAHAQMALASVAPEGLCAMVLDSGGFSNAFHGGIRQGGAFELKQATWAFRRAKEAASRFGDQLASAALADVDIKAWFKVMPWRRGHSPLSAMPEYEAYLIEQWDHANFDDYWKQSGIYAAGSYDAMEHVPQVHMSSWYDVYVRTALENFTAMLKRKRAVTQLIMGPWLHGDRNITHSGDVEFGLAAAFDGSIAVNWREFRVKWFNRWLKGQLNGVDAEPRVRLFLMGGGSGRKNAEGRLEHGGQWIQDSYWPLPETHFVSYYLHPDNTLSPAPVDASSGSHTYNFDPENPVPTIGGALTSGAPVFEGGAFDQRELPRFFGSRGDGLPVNARADVVTFESDVLTEDMAVIGPITVQLFISSDCPDTDFTAKLVDVYPPSADYPQGYAMNLTDGILRCRFRNSWEKPEAMEPGAVYEITIEPFATANLFKAGHRIRLDISSSNFPKYDVNWNTGASDSGSRERRIARNTVHTSRTHPSKVLLPVVAVSKLKPMKSMQQGYSLG